MEKYVYIHGVVAEGLPWRKPVSDYKALRNGLSSVLERSAAAPLPRLSDSVTVHWGLDTSAAEETRTLAQAQKNIAARIAAVDVPADWFGFSPLKFLPLRAPVRKLLQAGWADIVYYVGKEGKPRVRSLVWNNILDQVGTDEEVDLTIISHSAGTLIAIDLLYWVFGPGRRSRMGRSGMPSREQFEAAKQNWRIRRLVTLGSPIAPLLVRSAEVADILAGSDTARLDATRLGLGLTTHSGHDPVWLNVWDKDDILSFPVAPFYEGARVIDLYPDHGDSLGYSHLTYWKAHKVHRALAQHWA